MKSNIPELRFPEFKNEPEWEEKPLSKVGEVITGSTPATANLENYGGSQLFVSPADISDKRYITTTKTTLSKQGFKQTRQIKANSILVVCIGSTIGKVAQNKFDCATNQQINSIVPFDEYSNNFVYSALENSSSRIALLAGNHAVPIINKSSFSSVLILCPLFPEQQKIADCFSSIDNLITAQSKKVEALKEHKKGLMQQLFPQDGEEVPKLRFPEFKNAPKWGKVKLDKLGKLVSGLTYSPNDVREDGLLVLRSSNVQNGEIKLEDNVYVRTDIRGANLTEPNDILICVRNGSKALIGKNALIPDNMPLCTHGAFMTIFRANLPKFVYQLFQTNEYERQVNADLGATINSINGRHFINYEFNVPFENEQKKIADCLSSIDELITSSTKKVETLKEHKKGLMQKLFPSNEVK